MEISKRIKEARLQKGMTQQELADSVYVTRQTISKWELGKSVPDEVSMTLLCQRLELDNKEEKVLKRLSCNRKMIFIAIMGVVLGPLVLGIRYFLFKTGKLEDKKFLIAVKSIGFVLLVLYFRVLKDNVAYLLLPITTVSYVMYQYYKLSLERNTENADDSQVQHAK